MVWTFLRRWFSRGIEEDTLEQLDPHTTRLVVGLGNPGPEYAETRHNVGFRCVDELARRCGATWSDRSEFQSRVAIAVPEEGLSLALVKPQTYMNKSGEAVRAVVERLNLDCANTLVVYDDMDLPFGTLRLRQRGSPGTHNGMRSVVRSLATDGVPRLRIGIGQSAPGAATDHVLSEFSPEERQAAEDLIARAADAVLAWAKEGAAVAMNRYNKA